MKDNIFEKHHFFTVGQGKEKGTTPVDISN
jgi:hypothetical protein